VAIDEAGYMLTSTSPTGGTAAWTRTAIDSGKPLTSVSCVATGPGAYLCVAADNDGNVLASTNPTGGASAWTKIDADGTHALSSVSCAYGTEALCVASDGVGDVVTSTAPTISWAVTDASGTNALGPVSCPTTSLCVVEGNGSALYSTSPTGGASAWKTSYVPGTGGGLSCPTSGLCVVTYGASKDGAIATTT
jgi:hypothetical protein